MRWSSSDLFSGNPEPGRKLSFYCVPADNRDLNYDKYFKDGSSKRNVLTEFNSDNTELLSVEQVKAKLLTLPYIQEEIKAWENR